MDGWDDAVAPVFDIREGKTSQLLGAMGVWTHLLKNPSLQADMNMTLKWERTPESESKEPL